MEPADIAILLDSTYSIKRQNWHVMIQFFKDISDRLNYGPNNVRNFIQTSFQMLLVEPCPLSLRPCNQTGGMY